MSDLNLSTEEVKNKPSNKIKLPLKTRISNFFKNPKKRLIFIICMGLVLIAAFGYGLNCMTKDKPTTTSKVSEKKEVTPPEEPKFQAPLDGVMTDKPSSERHPLAIIVENDPAARPQNGLTKASIVYETVYDPAATTRFMAIFGTNEAEKVGPIRSARTFFVDWAHGFDAYLAHWGGNIDALEKIPRDKVYDLDEFQYSAPFWREKSTGLATEHTGYTSTIKLRTQAKTNKYSESNNFTVYKFKDDPTDKTTLPEKQSIQVEYSNADYRVRFDYDKATNSYKRFLAGKAHADAVDKSQITPKNIAVMTVARKQTVTKINEPGYTMTTLGSGNASFYLDGKQINGTWKKENASDRELFYDEAGKEMVFNRGQLWICVVASDKAVTTQ